MVGQTSILPVSMGMFILILSLDYQGMLPKHFFVVKNQELCNLTLMFPQEWNKGK